MKELMVKILIILLLLYFLICALLYFYQEHMIFFPEKLPEGYQFSFNQNFEEIDIKTKDKLVLNGVLFKADSSKGLIFYLHGNAGSIRSWGEVAETYAAFNYDLFMLDYRGYGKSQGSIESEEQIYNDNQIAYEYFKTKYSEDKIILLGYSIGSGPAAKLASTNQPKLLILQAPYFSLVDVMKRSYLIIPTVILKYKFQTHKFLKNCATPVVIFHGEDDEVIYYGSSIKLKEILKKTDRLITLTGQGHNGISYNPEYISAMRKLLNALN